MMAACTYRHRNCLDIDIFVHNVLEKPTYIIVNAAIFNRHNNILYELNSQYIIQKEDLYLWKQV